MTTDTSAAPVETVEKAKKPRKNNSPEAVDKRIAKREAVVKKDAEAAEKVSKKKAEKPAPFDYNSLETGAEHDFNINDLDLTLVRRVRHKISKSVVEDYAANIEALPPITVQVTKDGKPRVIGGLHRIEAHKLADAPAIRGIVTRYTREQDAIKAAISDNRSHGAHMTKEDKRAAVILAIKDGKFNSDRNIAVMIGCSPTTVGTIRAELVKSGEVEVEKDDEGNEVRVGSDGRTVKVAERETLSPEQKAYAKAVGYFHASDDANVANFLAEISKGERLRAVLATLYRDNREAFTRLFTMLATVDETNGEMPEVGSAEHVEAVKDKAATEMAAGLREEIAA